MAHIVVQNYISKYAVNILQNMFVKTYSVKNKYGKSKITNARLITSLLLQQMKFVHREHRAIIAQVMHISVMDIFDMTKELF